MRMQLNLGQHAVQTISVEDVSLTKERRSHRLLLFWRSTVGKKVVMSVTGAIGVGYVLAHMLGNLQVFEGPEKLNAYAALLKSNIGLLWTARSILIAAVILHIFAAYQLARTSQKSRPVGYKRWRAVGSDFASRTMRWTGALIALFIAYHLLHLTIGTVHPDFVEADVYHNVITGFRVWYVSVVYIAAMLMLALHLYHGVWSMCESLGFNYPKYNHLIRALATILTVIVVAGFIAIPAAVLLGFIS
jgi:succinate dehydrogenase / fumarate reductase cytochrome b subunit